MLASTNQRPRRLLPCQAVLSWPSGWLSRRGPARDTRRMPEWLWVSGAGASCACAFHAMGALLPRGQRTSACAGPPGRALTHQPRLRGRAPNVRGQGPSCADAAERHPQQLLHHPIQPFACPRRLSLSTRGRSIARNRSATLFSLLPSVSSHQPPPPPPPPLSPSPPCRHSHRPPNPVSTLAKS